ncbi:RNA-binding protein YlmH, contains S4-like domain [Lachnospiraceae bacterium KHCPX20]|nr:RNA-binding protein YlmH, contains S4-like domain [Lachnospiraceae bacterium KHCPX20]
MKDKDDLFLKRHFMDVAMRLYERGIPIYTDFLDLHEQGILQSLLPSLHVSVEFYGGFGYAQRQVAVFLQSDAFFEINDSTYPISALTLKPKNPRFAENLSHRDYLGALMNLGIERELIGDILIQEDGSAIVFCINRAVDILSGIHRIRHTEVIVEETSLCHIDYEPKFREVMLQLASNRIDALLSAAVHRSRKDVNTLLDQGKVFVNAKECYGHNHQLKENDFLSIRGIGKFEIASFLGETKKGKIKVLIRWFE